MMKKIIVFTGLMASGKGTACSFYIDKYGARMFRYSTMLRDILDRLYLPHDRENIQDLSTMLRARFGQDLMAKVIAHDVERSDASFIVVDGARRLEDIEYLRKVGGFHLVALVASPETRFQRITSRDENSDDHRKTWEQFLKEEQAESEAMVPQLMARADVQIDNNGDRGSLEKKLEEIYAKITSS